MALPTWASIFLMLFCAIDIMGDEYHMQNFLRNLFAGSAAYTLGGILLNILFSEKSLTAAILFSSG